MKKFLFIPLLLCMLVTLCCYQKGSSVETADDVLSQLYDTIVGNFSGNQIDTLICEPIDTFTDSEYHGIYNTWRVYSKNGSVDDLVIEGTIGLHLVPEGDLDGDGADEWGYVTQWVTSTWMSYYVYTYKNREGDLLYKPLPIWLEHLNPEDTLYYSVTEEQIASKSSEPGMVNVKFSSIRNDGIDFLIIDTIVPILNRKP